jgi:hypothetical protein
VEEKTTTPRKTVWRRIKCPVCQGRGIVDADRPLTNG